MQEVKRNSPSVFIYTIKQHTSVSVAILALSILAGLTSGGLTYYFTAALITSLSVGGGTMLGLFTLFALALLLRSSREIKIQYQTSDPNLVVNPLGDPAEPLHAPPPPSRYFPNIFDN